VSIARLNRCRLMLHIVGLLKQLLCHSKQEAGEKQKKFHESIGNNNTFKLRSSFPPA
jgi:hypothetical protein